MLAQIQHLVVYSGEEVANPVAARTRLKQNIILKLSRPVARRRAVTFQDLSGRWAVDRRYGRSIEYVANLYRKRFCKGRKQQVARKAKSTGQARRARAQIGSYIQKASLPDSARECRVQVASFGGPKTVLVQSITKQAVQLTALDVYPGFEKQMAKNFSDAHAPGGRIIASFKARAAALTKAHAMCKRITAIN